MNQKKTLLTLIAATGVSMLAGAQLVESRAYYSTNPGNAVGKPATITIDGDFSDWSEDMIVATCGANDIATAFKGSHENSVLDLYAVYAAWDDTNLYVAWQMCNTGDTWAREGDGPLTDGGRVGNVPLVVAISVDPASVGMTGKVTDGRFIWGDTGTMGVTFTDHVDHYFVMSGQGMKVNAGATMFVAADSEGNTKYDDPAYCRLFTTLGINYEMAEGFQPSHLWRQNTYADYDISGSLISDPEIINNIYDAANYDNLLATPYPSGLKPHDTSYDSFYEMNIPLSALGINRQWLESNGIGLRVIATRGESGIDCCPFDPSMVDNVFESYGKDASTSHEKDDIDNITYASASVGKMRTGSVDPVPDPTPTPDPTPDPTPTPDPVEGNVDVYLVDCTWTQPFVWIWDAGNDNKNYSGTTWPGAKMTRYELAGYANVWKFAFDTADTLVSPKVIFNPGSDQGKTADLDFVNHGIYDMAGTLLGTAATMAVETITDNTSSAPVYYNLQGHRVASPANGGLYIVRRGDKMSKEIF